jgi:peptidylamidoglycolate lyase
MRYHHVIRVVDATGTTIQSWPQHNKLFDQPKAPLGPRGPHKIKMSPYDAEKHVWVVDDNLHQIFKFTYDGNLVMTLGQMGVEGRGPNTFARPTDIDWLPDGTFFISDGYHGKRVAKFDPDGKFIMDWGSEPKDPNNPGPNEWNTVHSIAISKDRRIFVADRGHQRFQIFDENGKFLDMFSTREDHWPAEMNSQPYYHLITDDQFLWMGDGGTQRINKYDLNGNFLYGWGQPGGTPGRFWGPHQMTVDQAGNFYVAEVQNGRIQRFEPKPDADPDTLIGQEFRYSADRPTTN